MTSVTLESVTVRPGSLRLGDATLPLRRVLPGHRGQQARPGCEDDETAGPDGTDATAEITVRETAYRVRAWTFGERRRLIAAHLAPDGGLDVAGLTCSALERLVRPVPVDPEHRDLLGLAALAWSATAGAARPAPVPGVDAAAQAVRLAAATGWGPRELDGALASDVDLWFAALSDPVRGPADSPPAAPPASPQDGTWQEWQEPAGTRTFRLED